MSARRIKRARRVEAVSLLASLGETNTATMGRRLGIVQQSAGYLLRSLESDGCVTSRPARGLSAGKPQRLWTATGKPVPPDPTPVERRSAPVVRHRSKQFHAAELARVW